MSEVTRWMAVGELFERHCAENEMTPLNKSEWILFDIIFDFADKYGLLIGNINDTVAEESAGK